MELEDIQEEEEENYVLVALFAAIECGNLDGVQKLLNTKNTFDVNQSNKHGESALHISASEGQLEILKYLQSKGIDLNAKDKLGDGAVYRAARQGHVEMLQFLSDQGVSLDEQNKNGESAIHAAVRYGQVEVLEFLCSQADINVNVHDKLGETPLHNAIWHGLPGSVCALLCDKGCNVDDRNKEEETPLHSAASRGDIECIKVLLERGATATVQDKRGSTPLHLACRRQHIPIALMLLHSGAQLDTVDQFHESALHIAAKDGLLAVVQTLCAFGCMVDMFSKDGYTPLHLAARNGHIEVVRCLLLSGAEPDIPNKDDVPAEILSLSYGHQEIAELLTRLKPEKREMCIRQLMPSDHKLSKIKVKLFGSRGSGKTTLIDSLKCGYFGSFFRKARLSTSNSLNSQRQKSMENGGPNTTRHNSLPAQMSQDVPHESYTRGVDVHYATITGSGELSIWDFSGFEPYYMYYDQLIGDPNCIHIITFSLMEKPETQLKQVTFWLNFLRARVPPLEPFGHCGCHPLPARVIFVATHADKANCAKNAKGDFYSEEATILLDKIADVFWTEFDLPEKVYVVDSHLAMSSDVKAIRCHLGDMKDKIVRRLPRSNGFLEAVVISLQHWRKVNAMFPVVTWPQFMDTVRTMVNLLASEEHLRELMHLLQLMGEVIYVETGQEEDLVVLYPKWLCNDVIGNLLSHEHIIHTRVTGIFSVLDIGLMFPDCPADDLLNLLTALEFCTPCDNDGDLEYEFPCLNFCENLSGLWEKDPERLPTAVYCGVRITCPDVVVSQLKHLFPRLQVHLRRNYIKHPNIPDQDLYQWHHGSKFCRGAMECLITLEESDQIIEIKARGPDKMRTELYYFIEEICSIVNDQLEDCVPGLNLQRKVLSPMHLKEHQENPHVYTNENLISMQLESRSTLQLDSQRAEEFSDVICCGSKEITNNLTLGIDLHVSYLSVYTRKALSMLLDPKDALGKDWCLLAIKMGLTDALPELDQPNRKKFESKTDCILEEWSRTEDSTISNLILKLKELGRDDAADLVINTGPVYRVFPSETESEGEKKSKETPSEALPSDEPQSE